MVANEMARQSTYQAIDAAEKAGGAAESGLQRCRQGHGRGMQGHHGRKAHRGGSIHCFPHRSVNRQLLGSRTWSLFEDEYMDKMLGGMDAMCS